MKNFFSLGVALLLFLSPLTTRALSTSFAPHPYYPKVFFEEIQNPNLPSAHLRDWLFKILSKAHVPGPQGHDELVDECPSTHCIVQKTLNYREARQILFGHLHLRQTENGYTLRDVYCSKDYTEEDFPSGPRPAPGQIPNPEILNTEHTWPQSKFSRAFPKELQKGDLHILFPVSPSANSSRSNHPFSNVNTVTSQPCASAKLGYDGRNSGLRFEPPDAHKGNVARAIFYFSVRYQMPVDENQEETLRGWMRLDPVDDDERARNEEIFKVQGNRNPFIDYPELVERIADF